ncbi:unnamed protein product [Fusarium graminearum]|nr:hypothetical protein FG05_06248 [Fusarium graminearum]VTO93225.1 unnamed protein product [Fusarium graminearum]
MSKAEPADQVKFLVSCIGHTSNGRPDFQAVADELSIVSKAAAQKRYERMLKAHGISRPGALVAANNGDGNGDSPPATPTTPGKRKAKGETTGSAKKPRTPRAKAKKESDDEEEPKPKSKASATKRKVKKEEVVEKKEEEQDEASAKSPKSLSDVPASDES